MQHFLKSSKRSELPQSFPDVLQFGGQPTQPAPCGLLAHAAPLGRAPAALRDSQPARAMALLMVAIDTSTEPGSHLAWRSSSSNGDLDSQ